MWNIRCYSASSGKNEVQGTYDKGADDLRAGLSVALEYLRMQDRQDWARPKAARLDKNKTFRDYYEIRFKAGNLQQRPIGYFGPGSNDFTILIWATEKGNKLLPPTWFDIAERRRKQIESGECDAPFLILEEDEAPE